MSYQPLWLQDLVAYSIQAAALVGVGVVMARALRLRVPRVRHAYWQALLVACVLLPLLQPWRPDVLESSATTLTKVTLAPAPAPAPKGPSIAEIVLWLICSGFVLRIVWMALGFGRLWLYRRRAERMEQTPEAVQAAQRLAPVSPAFFISRQIPTPATFGFFRPAVLFPASFLKMEPALQRAIALHELLHVERSDWVWNMFEEIMLTLLWFHLPLWWVVRSARLSREQVVDAEAIRRSGARRPYLKALLEMAGQMRLAESLPAPLFLRENQLAERVALMMKEVRMSRKRLTVSILTAAVTLLIAGASLAWAFPLKTSTPQAETPAVSPASAKNAVGTIEYQGKDYKFAGSVYKVGKNVSAPIPTYKPEPPYTPEAQKAHLEGIVVLRAVIGTNGKVVEAKEVSKPLGQGLDESALKTVYTWKFKPGMRKGAAVPVKVMIEVSFRGDWSKKQVPVSQNSAPLPDPPTQGNQSASKNTDKSHTVLINQEEIQRQAEEALNRAKIAQEAPSMIDRKKIQQQVEEALKQATIADQAAAKINQAEIQRQVDQALQQTKVAQEAASEINEKKIQQQVEKALKQAKITELSTRKLNTVEMQRKIEDMKKQLAKANTPEMRLKMQEQMKQIEKMNTPEMKRQIQEAMKQLQEMNMPEIRSQMQEQMEQLKKMNTPEMREQLKHAMEQAKIAQETAAKINKAEIQREVEQARKEVDAARLRAEAEKARKDAEAARAEAKEARKDAAAARKEVEKLREQQKQERMRLKKQRKRASPWPPVPPKPAPSAVPSPAPSAPPKSPAPPSSGIAGGVQGGVSGGVTSSPPTPAPAPTPPAKTAPPVPPIPQN